MAEPSPPVAFITGASSGIGKAIATRLLADGLTVVVAARRVERMDDLKALGALVVGMDISKQASVDGAVKTILRRHGGIDVLINNAGFGCYGSVEETSIEDARAQFEVNLFGLARLTQLVLPGMRQRHKGRIINISSMGGKIYTPLGAWYHATKHALEGWSDCLRLEVKEFGIDVVIIEPGIIQTEFAAVMMDPMLRRSGQGPYGAMAKGLALAFERSYTSTASPAGVVADSVARAVRAKTPKTRYAVGALARPLLFLRHWLGDRTYDWGVMKMLN
jgi:short-subunit dehydrogenase